MPEKNPEIEKMEKKIAELDARQKQLNAKKRALRSRISQQNRKARTKRLIEKGAVLEKFQGENADKVTADASLSDLLKLKEDLRHYKSRYESLKSFSKGVTFAKNNPNDPTEQVRTVFGNWVAQEKRK